MTNQRRSRFLDVLTHDDSSESRRERLMAATFWTSTVTDADPRVIDLAAARASRLR